MRQLYDVNNGDEISMFVLIQNADVRVARNGNEFIAFRFQDPSGSMDGMYWSAKPEEIERFQAGRVVYLQGRRELYQGRPQVKIERLRLAEAGEPNDPTLYVERVDVHPDQIKEELNDALFMIHEPSIARIVRRILKDYEQDFYTYPAAKRNHHAVAGGLSFHTISMLRIAKNLLEIYPNLNASLLIAGVILHDIGKLIELSGAVSTEYTLKGQLLGHIVIADELIDRACQELGIDSDTEPVILLKHMILAHHGKQEYGSPVMPHVLEAEILHYIDDMDAKINMITQALNQVEPGEFTGQIYPLDRRQIYRPKFK